MGNPRGFLQIGRKKAPAAPVNERVRHFHEFEQEMPDKELREQASRCMDCGIPFCHKGCPLGNLIPEWNDHMYKGRVADAIDALEATNNFPEITGRVCPAPCEASCVLNIEGTPVSIKEVEKTIANRTFERGLPDRAPRVKNGRSVAVVGSGPAGLAAAQQLARMGYDVSVFERSDRIGGLLRYGIPDFKLEKHVLDRRVEQMEREGVTFHTGVDVGVDVKGGDLRRDYDAVVLAIGAGKARDLQIPGHKLGGVHFAMQFLEQQNRRVAGDAIDTKASIHAGGKRVVVLGGGDTGSDCVGTSIRHGAKSVTSLELMAKPPVDRLATNPWPEWPLVMRTSSSHEEGGTREYAVLTKRVLGDAKGNVRALEIVHVAFENGQMRETSAPQEIPCDLLLLAMGFTGVEALPLFGQLGLAPGPKNTLPAVHDGVFACGDAVRGASLVVWAIAEGRKTAEAVDAYLKRAAELRDVG